MSRIQSVFLKKTAYVGYLTAGDDGYEHSLQSMLALIKGGIDILEIGIPFSDPIADGPTIQKASLRAIESGITMEKVFNLCAGLRKQSSIPIILFSYYNPIFRYKHNFYQRAKELNIDGLLVVDLPFEESKHHLAQCKKFEIDPIFLISPSTPISRIKQFNQYAKGMYYYVCRNGTTGIKQTLPEGFSEKIKLIKEHINLPLSVGFGISTKDMAAQVIQHADGFVIGSRFVETAHHAKNLNELTELVKQIDPRKIRV